MRAPFHAAAAATLIVAGLAACSGGSATPSALSISPANPGTINGTQLFSAVLTNDDVTVTWSLTGAGALSNTTGNSVTYSAPQAGASGSVTITATTSDGLTAHVTATLGAPQIPAGVIPGLSAAVQIAYDPQDIPHLTCATELDCLEAQGYLQARDRLFQMDLFRRTARGQLASMVGAIEESSDKQFLTFFTTRDGQRIEDQLVAALDADTASKIGSFVNGINVYIHQLKNNPAAELPGEYAQLPYPLKASDIPDWTAQDTLAIGRLQQFQLSESIEEEVEYGTFAAVYGPGGPLADPSKMNTYIRSQDTERSYTLPIASASGTRATPSRIVASRLADYAGVLALARQNIGEARGLLGTLGIDTGSNNWAVDASHSATGQAMVANDPHLSLQYPPLFHLIAMTANDSSGLDLQGGSFPGIPGALIGRGKHVGWGDTVVGYDVTDLYMEKVETCVANPNQEIPCVHFTGAGADSNQQLTLIHVPVSISVRQANGSLVADPYAIYVNPAHGPFISYAGGATAISMRWTGHEVTSDLRAFLKLNVATSIGGVADATTAGSTTAFAALHDMATGAQNFVLADDQGNIGYDPHGLVPKRPWAGTTGYPWFPLPGDGSAEWGSGSAADHCAGTPTSGALPSANCWYADTDLPHADASNGTPNGTGFLVTANSDPAGYGDTNVPISVRNGAAFYLSFDWDEPTGFRHKRISTLLANATAGGKKVAVSDMQTIQTDHVSSLAGAFIPAIDLVATFAGPAVPPEFTAAVSMLNAWNASGLNCPTGLTGSSPSSAVSTTGTDAADSAACMLFHSFLRTLLNNVFDDDLAVAGLSLDSGAAIRGMLYMLEPGNLAPTPIDQTFCNNVGATGQTIGGTTSCPKQVIVALATAYDTLTGFKGAPSNWIWGRAHTLTTVSPVSPLVDGTFGAGPYARPGGELTVDVGNISFSSTDPLAFPYTSGSNLRLVAEMNPATANTKMQLPGPERDGPQGVFASSPDLIGQYVTNTYFDFAYSAQSAASVVSTQTLNPGTAQ